MQNVRTMERQALLKGRGFRAAISSALVSVAFVVSNVSAAHAVGTGTDPLAGAGDGIFTDLGSYLTGHLVPAVLVFATIGIAAGLVIKWVKKARAAA